MFEVQTMVFLGKKLRQGQKTTVLLIGSTKIRLFKKN